MSRLNAIAIAGVGLFALALSGCGADESTTAGYSSDVSKEMSKELEKNRQPGEDMPPPQNVLGDGKSAEVK